jgi:hypothetical protein
MGAARGLQIEGRHKRRRGATGRLRRWACAVALTALAAAILVGAAPGTDTSGDASTPVWVKVSIDNPEEGATTGRNVRVYYSTYRRCSDCIYTPVAATCSLDRAAAVTCPSTWGTTGRRGRRHLKSNSASKRYSNLAGGKHTVVLRVRDRATGARARATRSWTVDAMGPTLYFVSDPFYTPEEGSTVNYNWAAFSWSSEDEDWVYGGETRCRLDRGAWVSCDEQGYSVQNLANGPHAVSVKGRDKYGNFGATITRHWTVKCDPYSC